MDIGKLRHRITLVSYEILKDDIGSEKRKWKKIDTVWASLEPLSGRELMATGMEKAEATIRVTIRYRKDMGPNLCIRFGSRVFEVISAINPEEKNIFLTLMCKELIQ